MSINLGSSQIDIKLAIDHLVTALNNEGQASGLDANTKTNIQTVIGQMGAFESLAINNNETASENIQLNNYRQQIATLLNSITNEPVCSTTP